MKARAIALYLGLSLVTTCFAASVWEKFSYKPKEGFVPDERTVALRLLRFQNQTAVLLQSYMGNEERGKPVVTATPLTRRG